MMIENDLWKPFIVHFKRNFLEYVSSSDLINFNQFIGFWNPFDLIYQSVCHLLNTDTGGSIYFNISVNDKPTASKSSNKHEQIQEGASILTILSNEKHF